MQITLQDILLAKKRIQNFLIQTPLIHSNPLSQLTGAEVWLKMENCQKTGAFKLRGALNKVFSLSKTEKQKGVITASSGNHAQGVALAAQLVGTSAVIVVPQYTPETKRTAIQRLGAELVVHGANYDESEAYAMELAKTSGRTYIHGYEDPYIIAGQGTVGLESLLEQPDFDVILVPAGGGGLICGIAIAAKSINPKIQVIGVQSVASPPWYYSFHSKRMVEVEYKETLAEGLLGKIGEVNLKLALQYVDDFILVEESEIAEAMCWMATQHHVMIEGSAAVGVAALIHQRVNVAGKKVLNVITGGNVDAARIAALLMNRQNNVTL